MSTLSFMSAMEFGANDTKATRRPVVTQPALDPRAHELAMVAAMTATGGRALDEVPLAGHIHAALNVGATPQDITGAILHMIPYAGFPQVERAITAANAVYRERGLQLAPA